MIRLHLYELHTTHYTGILFFNESDKPHYYMTEALTIQIFTNALWQDAAELIITDPSLGHTSACTLNYSTSHLLNNYNQRAEAAVGISYAVEAFGYSNDNWMRFLDDIIPAGASRKYWVNKLGIEDKTFAEQDFALLKYGSMAPIGNLRIKESLPEKTKDQMNVDFSIDQVANHDIDFIEYAQQNGATTGGASGAGGVAPKVLIRCNAQDRVWIDSYQDNHENLDLHYLVKFPRGNRNIDKDILRAEFHYYHELEQLGFNTIATEKMRLIEGERVPSLWLPRFDVYIENKQMNHCGMESVYSILEEPPAKPLLHTDVLARMIKKMQAKEYLGDTQTLLDQTDGVAKFVIEWVRRDLLNIAFGNSDNHGRNTAFLKTNNYISLAPIFDFAPMKADPEIVTRSFTWGPGMELGGHYDFQKISLHLQQWIEPDKLLSALQQTASQLHGLHKRLEDRGVPNSITAFPTIGLSHLEEKLSQWGLL